MNQSDWDDVARSTWKDGKPIWERARRRRARNEFIADTLSLASMPVHRTLRLVYVATDRGFSGLTDSEPIPAGDECTVSLLQGETGGRPSVNVMPTAATIRSPDGQMGTRFVVHNVIVQIPSGMFVELQTQINK